MGKRVSKEIDNIILENYPRLGSKATWELIKEYNPVWVKKRANALGVKKKINYINLIGKQFGRLTVLVFKGRKNGKRGLRWKCGCICGKKLIVYGDNLTTGKSKSCGCLAKEITSKARLGISKKIGTKIGRLLVLKILPRTKYSVNSPTYECKCDCGKVIITHLTNCRSCGCLQRDQLIERNKKQLGWATETVVWSYYRRNAKTRNLSWELTREHFVSLITKPCYYCKVEPWNLVETKSNDWKIISGVDRKDNKIGYTIENSVPCCKICNRAKLDLELDVFEKWLLTIKKT